MTNWFIIQDLQSFSEHPDWIGCELKEDSEEPIHGQFKNVKKGDKVAYYGKGDKVIAGIFEVLSDKMEVIQDDPYWTGPMGIYRLKPISLPPEGQQLDFKKLLFTNGVTFQLFPEKSQWGHVLWNHYIYALSDQDLQIIQKHISDSQFLTTPDEGVEEKIIIERLGSPFETANLLFEPIDEMGVVYLFASYHRKLGFPYVVRLRSRFPDATVITSRGETKTAELEFRAVNFLNQGHPLDGCDFIVCWENDWEDAPENAPSIISLKVALADIFAPRR